MTLLPHHPPGPGRPLVDSAGRRRQPQAGLVVIGNEVLSAKVRDLNTPLILERLNRAGVRIGEVALLADDLSRIASVVQTFSARFDLVITTGGVGPTHDDCTWRSVAAAFDLPMHEHPDVLRRLEGYLGAQLSPEQRRLAWLPVDTRMEDVPGRWPLLVCRNVYVLPGVPSLVAGRIEQLCSVWQCERPHLATVYLAADEFFVVQHIDAVVGAFADLEIGSYPIFEPGDHKLRLTFEGWDRGQVSAAVDDVVARIGPAQLVRVVWRDEPKEVAVAAAGGGAP